MARFIISFCIVLAFYSIGFSQEKPKYTLYIGTNPFKIITSFVQPISLQPSSITKVELETGLMINHKWLFINQLGYCKAIKEDGFFYAQTKGYYIRTSLFYMIGSIEHNSYYYNNLGLGPTFDIRLGFSFCTSIFQDAGSYTIKAPTWGDKEIPIESKKYQIHSIEPSIIIQNDCKKYFYIKGSVGIRCLIVDFGSTSRFPYPLWTIPGFGNSKTNNVILSASITLGIRLSLNKKNNLN